MAASRPASSLPRPTSSVGVGTRSSGARSAWPRKAGRLKMKGSNLASGEPVRSAMDPSFFLRRLKQASALAASFQGSTGPCGMARGDTPSEVSTL